MQYITPYIPLLRDFMNLFTYSIVLLLLTRLNLLKINLKILQTAILRTEADL